MCIHHRIFYFSTMYERTAAELRFRPAASLGEVCAWLARTSGGEEVSAFIARMDLGREDVRHVVVIIFAGPLEEDGETLLRSAYRPRDLDDCVVVLAYARALGPLPLGVYFETMRMWGPLSAYM